MMHKRLDSTAQSDVLPHQYGNAVADLYDDWYGPALDTERAVSALATLADGGPALELGCGTGRLTIPLAMQGIAMYGIDISPKMLDRLRSKPGGDKVHVTEGDFSHFALPTRFRLIYCVFNTFPQLPDQESQLECIASAANHLLPGGRFVVEIEIPNMSRWHGCQTVEVRDLRAGRVIVEMSRHFPKEQRIISQYVVISGDGLEFCPEVLRYAWPAEIRLMARIAGLELAQTWSDWGQSPLVDDAAWAIMVFEAASDPGGGGDGR